MEEKLVRNEDGYISADEIDRSLQKKFRKSLYSKFVKAIKKYDLISEGDKIAVAISGGKDSLLCAKMFQALHKYSDFDFDVEYLSMDPGYSKENREKIEKIYAYLDIPVKIYDSDVFAVAEYLNSDRPCYMCARMRRGFLYRKAADLGCNKLALGHHFDDVIETNVINFLWAGSFQVMMPKLKAKNFPGIELIRPLYLIDEADVIRWRDYCGIEALDCACTVTAKSTSYTRKRAKEMIKEWGKEIPNVRHSIFKSGENIHKNAILGYIDQGEKHSFLEDYENRE